MMELIANLETVRNRTVGDKWFPPSFSKEKFWDVEHGVNIGRPIVAVVLRDHSVHVSFN